VRRRWAAARAPLALLLGAVLLTSSWTATSSAEPAVAVGLAADRPVQRPAAVVRASAFGMHDGQDRVGAGYGALRLWDTGTTWARLEPAPGRFDWARLDTLVERARTRGVAVTLVLGSTPAWAARDPLAHGASWLGAGASSPPRSNAAWAAYVDAVVSRYRGRIDSYEIWNEAALPEFWKGTPDQLARLTQIAAARIKAKDPAALVVSTSLLPRQRAWQRWATTYLEGLQRRRWPVDVFAMHSYQPNHLADPDGRVTTVRTVQRLLTRFGVGGRPLWDTEVNYTSPAYAQRKVEGTRAADWMARTYLDSLRLGLGRTYWYPANDSTRLLAMYVRRGGPAATGLVTVQEWVVGATFGGCRTSAGSAGAVVTTCALQRGRARSWVAWSSSDRPSPLPVRASTVCTLLRGCSGADGGTRVTTSPVLLR
jgi:hypothetical protein